MAKQLKEISLKSYLPLLYPYYITLILPFYGIFLQIFDNFFENRENNF